MLIIILLVCNWVGAVAKNIVHTIDRGETIDYIASVYGTSVEAIRVANPGLTEFYTGMDIIIPVDKPSGQLEEQKLSVQNSLFSEAESLRQKGKYKEAVKLYDKIQIEGKTPLVVYYNRGKVQFERGKLNESITDLNYVIQNDSDGSYPGAKNLLAEVKRQKEIKDAERQQMWANIGAALATTAQVAANVYVAHETEKAQRKALKNAGSATAVSTGNYTEPESKETEPSAPAKSKGQCGFCGGKGSTVEYVANYGIEKDFWCDECGKKVVNGHYHKKCTHCGGTGVK